MRFNELLPEMTMRVGSYERLAEFSSPFAELLQSGTHAGDIEHLRVFRSSDNSMYAAFDQATLAAFWKMTGNVLELIFVFPAYRSAGLMSVILFFMQRNEGLPKIILGSHHSRATVEALKRIYHRFDSVYWQKGDAEVQYDPNTVDSFYSLSGPSGWVIVLESSNIVTEHKFFDGLNLCTWYFNLLD